MDLSFLPGINATINLAVAILLVRGLWLIEKGERRAHQVTMVSALVYRHFFWRAT